MVIEMPANPPVLSQEPALHLPPETATKMGQPVSPYFLIIFGVQEYWKGRPVVKGDRISEADWPYPKEPQWEEEEK